MSAKHMTEGSALGHLLTFAVPMILGNLFQLTYNAVDSIIVGRVTGEAALAAIGCANPIMNIMIFLIVGVCVGMSVLLGEFFGRGDETRFREETATALLSGAIFTALLTALCLLLTEPVLRLLRTPEEIMGQAAAYLHVITLGLIFTFLYNFYASALRAVGDAKTPLYFLAAATLLNVLLDIWFVAGLSMGAAGAALATILSQGVCALSLVLFVLLRVPQLRLKSSELRINRALLKKTLHYSWASAMQQTCLYVGKVLVQGAVNPLGVQSIAAFNAVNRIDDFALTPEQSIGSSMTVYLAQNRGAGLNARIRVGARWGLLLEAAYGAAIGSAVFFLAKPLMGLFLKAEESAAMALGVSYLTGIAPFYFLPGVTNGFQGFFRGMGRMGVTLIATFSQIVVRVLFSYWLTPKMGFPAIWIACVAGWVVMVAFELPTMLKDPSMRQTRESRLNRSFLTRVR